MFNRDEEAFDELTMDDCPICREMRDEWGVIDAVPFEYLTARGVELPDPAQLDDESLHDALWRMIHGLAGMRIFLEMTDHLSDRQLYEQLWREDLRQPMMFSPEDTDSATHLPMLADTDIDGWLRYYADERDREYWRRNSPEVVVPPHEEPPYDRDSMLPSRWEGMATEH